MLQENAIAYLFTHLKFSVYISEKRMCKCNIANKKTNQTCYTWCLELKKKKKKHYRRCLYPFG